MAAGQFLVPLMSGFVITVIFMPLFIGYLRFKKEGQTIREEGPKWHAKKNGTPTMGGLLFIIAAVVSSIWVGLFLKQLTNSLLIAMFILVLYGILGFSDDFIKVFRKQNLGLRAWQKLLGQIIGGIVFIAVYFHEGFSTALEIPVIGTISSNWFFCVFVLVWLVGFSNAVNLTDGIDGLVAGLATISFATYTIIAFHQNQIDVAIFGLSIIGGLLGFLIYNKKPAQIFMGDVGSLALGGALAAMSILLHREFSLLLVGLVYVIETASVMLQVGSFKLFHKRIFKMSPIHHHFEMSGWSEWRIDISFWLFSIICSAIYLLIF
ncbi:phospho-N-acetylmuramoyl-pentapeptide-transferase [Latilactobacillus curvatus]|uniref:Phospho-N-acetylmuramoyl-pentapeptide-transferase n=1 Tax=Latilactobacillus curvatus JCM 1096 = DSM 20019 TaxID=1293592 RepID=A0AAJ0LI17_LATCU|nr:phospho-N-acetylmuramoyl-pentapeptide-transferase [Latilactobacillus curvatus]KRK93272.1 phospho-N-acetylmuramoyl-pentapeptide-transferase [Latilactobacillus curvatus JCM 1096 = DSM 20019]MCP8862547.1 phospho-N-acetylmuramoyl-pentapeptide-transferase [Latilactobacillus curvatus]MCT3530115.1 phospho-N-acetylmuramoyl-pentapeptide-transferase [Latilactobacillus curvatus]MDG2987784.1 phospho-N-acetylmuramoyl-pentapeptide-transferase [Latilactobacillus curvatus]QAS49134.1 phospho-N-acetylmuramoy